MGPVYHPQLNMMPHLMKPPPYMKLEPMHPSLFTAIAPPQIQPLSPHLSIHHRGDFFPVKPPPQLVYCPLKKILTKMKQELAAYNGAQATDAAALDSQILAQSKDSNSSKNQAIGIR